ncbi:hypothetical protein [Haloplanus vescus]|uniref:hypothetical protein n=1 Tax=Haloplanus vescus TaxID=555874 RepID=UPI001FE205B5|nr:hypothetical protein [Haloplanus vescus]
MSGAPESPIDGQVFMLAAAKASVAPSKLSDLLSRVQADVGGRLDVYRRDFERVAQQDDREVFLVPTGHWEQIADRLDFGERERKAVARAHAEQLRSIGSDTGRNDEFETALEIREAVVVGT